MTDSTRADDDVLDLSVLRDPVKYVRLSRGGEKYAVRSPSIGDLKALRKLFTDDAINEQDRTLSILKRIMPDAPDSELEALTAAQMNAILRIAEMPVKQLDEYAQSHYPNGSAGTTDTASGPATPSATSSGVLPPQLVARPLAS